MNWNAVPDAVADKRFGQVTEEQQARYLPMAYERLQKEWPWLGVANTWFFKRPDFTWQTENKPEYLLPGRRAGLHTAAGFPEHEDLCQCGQQRPGHVSGRACARPFGPYKVRATALRPIRRRNWEWLACYRQVRRSSSASMALPCDSLAPRFRCGGASGRCGRRHAEIVRWRPGQELRIKGGQRRSYGLNHRFRRTEGRSLVCQGRQQLAALLSPALLFHQPVRSLLRSRHPTLSRRRQEVQH